MMNPVENWGSQGQGTLGHIYICSLSDLGLLPVELSCVVPPPPPQSVLPVGGQLYWGCQISSTPAGFLLLTFCH